MNLPADVGVLPRGRLGVSLLVSDLYDWKLAKNANQPSRLHLCVPQLYRTGEFHLAACVTPQIFVGSGATHTTPVFVSRGEVANLFFNYKSLFSRHYVFPFLRKPSLLVGKMARRGQGTQSWSGRASWDASRSLSLFTHGFNFCYTGRTCQNYRGRQ